MKKIVLLGACLLASVSFPVMAQTTGPEVVVVRINESPGTVRVAITRGDQQTETQSFDNGNSLKDLTTSSQGYYKIIQQLYQRGFRLASTFSSPWAFNNGGGSTTLIFTKEQ